MQKQKPQRVTLVTHILKGFEADMQQQVSETTKAQELYTHYN